VIEIAGRGIGKAQVKVPTKIWKQLGHGPPGLTTGSNRRHHHIGVNRKQSQQFNAGVTGPAYNTYFDHDINVPVMPGLSYL
jgi:hypothetical protein